jgi:hypothetical protein
MLVIGFEYSNFRVRGVLDQQIKDRTHLVVDYKRLGAEIAELRRLVKEMRSQMGGMCSFLFAPRFRQRLTSSSLSSSSAFILD